MFQSLFKQRLSVQTSNTVEKCRLGLSADIVQIKPVLHSKYQEQNTLPVPYPKENTVIKFSVKIYYIYGWYYIMR